MIWLIASSKIFRKSSQNLPDLAFFRWWLWLAFASTTSGIYDLSTALLTFLFMQGTRHASMQAFLRRCRNWNKVDQSLSLPAKAFCNRATVRLELPSFMAISRAVLPSLSSIESDFGYSLIKNSMTDTGARLLQAT